MKRKQIFLILLFAGAAAAGLVAFVAPGVYPYYDDDSAPYVEAAQNLRASRGLVTRPYGYDEFEVDSVPFRVFQPVYPFMIFLGTLTGLDVHRSAVWIPRICFILLPAALYAVLGGVIGRGAAATAAILSTFMPAVVFQSVLAMSDTPFLLAALVSFAALFRAIGKGGAVWALAGGVAAGIALGIRNAGYSLPVAVVAGMLAGRMLGLIPAREAIRIVVRYAAGFIVGYLPVLVRNVVAFGDWQSYSMPPSGQPVTEVLRGLLRGFDRFFIGRLIPWPGLVVLFLLFFAVSLALLLGRGGWSRLKTENRRRLLSGSILLIYAIAGLLVLVTAASLFQLDEIGPRFLMQYHWILVGWLCAFGGRLAADRRLDRGWGRVALTGLMLALFVFPQVGIAKDRIEEMAGAREIAEDHEALSPLIRALPADVCVTAAHAPQLRLMYDRPVYQFGYVSPAGLAEYICHDRELVVILFPYDYELFADWWAVFDGTLPDGYREIGRSGEIVVLAHYRF